jgi:DNA repair exonuclease SbcCD ATPase subunit
VQAIPDLVLPQTQLAPELDLPQAQVLGELVMEPINKALQEENGRLKTEIEVLKEREMRKQESMDEYKAKVKSVEEESRRDKDEITSLKEKEIRLTVENEFLKRREEELRRREEELCRREEELRSDRTMLQTMMSSLMNGIDDRKRKRNEETD